MAIFDPINPPLTVTPDVLQLGLPDPNIIPYPLPNPGFAFNRSWLVAFSTPTPAIGPPPPPAIAYNSLRTVFEVEKNAFSTSNKGKITLYNLADLSRMRFVKGVRMTLAVGYGGQGGVTIPIFTNGAIARVRHERKGPDIVSTFEAGEGESALQEAIFNGSFPPGTPVTTIVAAIIGAMGLIQGPTIGLLPLPYNSGTAFSGPCKTLLDRILVKELGLRWWVSGFVVYIAQSGSASNPVAIAVSEQTGLIGAPNLGSGQGGDNVLTFTSLINPFLVPGTVVTIVSKFLTAIALIKTAKFEGDTHASKWTVACECEPLSAAGPNSVSTEV